MRYHIVSGLAVTAASLALAAGSLTTANAAHTGAAKAPAGQKIVTSGLNGPSEIQFGPGGNLYIANRDNGNVVRSHLGGGHGTTVFTRAADSGAVPISSTETYLLQGEHKHGEALFRGNPKTGKFHKVASLIKFELAHNPDGQKQCTGKNCDSLSNPYYILKTTRDILIADAGGNDIVAYNRADGTLHTYHVFPNITDTKACAHAKNNDPRHPGCDPVPTGLALGPNETLYVSLLGAEAPNSAKVVELDLQTGALLHTWGHMTAVDGVTVSPTGVIYASELEYGLNQKKPNLNATGRIVRIENGHRTYAAVATPSGLAWHDGALYAGSHSVDGQFAHIPNAGVVVKVRQSAFRR